MAKFQLSQGETLIGSGMMAYKVQKFPVRRTRGTIYVTDQRVCYYESLSNFVYMDLTLSEIEGYATKHMIFTFVNIRGKDGKVYSYSGFPAKKLQGWLDQAGVKKLS